MNHPAHYEHGELAWRSVGEDRAFRPAASLMKSLPHQSAGELCEEEEQVKTAQNRTVRVDHRGQRATNRRIEVCLASIHCCYLTDRPAIASRGMHHSPYTSDLAATMHPNEEVCE